MKNLNFLLSNNANARIGKVLQGGGYSRTSVNSCKSLVLNRRSHCKSLLYKVAAIFVLLFTLGVGQMWGGPTFSGGYAYFYNKGGWSDSYKYLCIGKGTSGDASYTEVRSMTAITNTKLWYNALPTSGWGDATYMAVVGNGSSWGSGKWGTSNLTNANHRTASVSLGNWGFSSGNVNMLTPANGNNDATLSLDYIGNAYSSLNKSQTINVKVTTDGGSTYSTPSTSPATISFSSKTFSSYTACGTTSSGSFSGSTKTMSKNAGYTATTTLTYSEKSDDYTFVCWHDGSSSVGTGTSYTYYPTAATTITARFTQNYPSGKVLYLKPNSDWKSDGARFAAYFYGATGNTWVDCSRVGESDYWSVTVPDGYRGYVIFCRMNGADATNDFNDSHRWNQTSSLMYDASHNGVEITGWNESQNRISVATATITGTFHYFPGETISLTVTPLGDDGAAKTYQWYKGGTAAGNAISGATSATYTKASCTYDDAGAYYCKVTWGGNAHWADNSTAYNVKILRLWVNGSRNGDPYGSVDFTKVNSTTATATINLGLLWTYGFSIGDGCGNYYGNTGTMTESNCTGWTMNTTTQCAMTTTNATNYTFTVNYSNLAAPVVSVTYPKSNQAASKTIYFDNNVLKWANVWYRIGRSNHSSSTQMTKVSGTANLYKVTTSAYDNFYSWLIANAQGGTGDNKSIYNTKNTPAITSATNYIGNAVTASSVTVTPGSSPSTGGTSENNNCNFYGQTITSGMKTDAVTITAPTNGTITVSYTNTSGSAASFTSGSQNLAHTCIITPTGSGATGYHLSGLTVNGNAHTSGNTYTVTDATTIAATFAENTYNLTFTHNGHGTIQVGGVTVAAGGTAAVNHFTTKTLVATPATGYYFTGWTVTGTNAAAVTIGNTSNASTTIKATNTNATVTANFAPRWTVTGNTAALGNWDTPGDLVLGNISTTDGVTTGYVEVSLAAHTSYEIKMWDKAAGATKYVGYATDPSEINYSNSGTAYNLNTYPGYNFKFLSAGAGTYRITRDMTNNKVIITYPTAYKVTYNGNGKTSGSVPVDPVYYGSGETVTVLGNTGSLAKTGYTFDGWNTSQYISGTARAVGSTFAISANVTLYAKWKQTVTLHDNNGGSHNGSATAIYKKAGPFTPTAPTRTGYTVEGYYAEEGCTNKVMTDAGALVNYTGYVESSKWVHSGATTLYAKWTEVTHTVTVAKDPAAGGTTNVSSVTGVGVATASGTITATANPGYYFTGWTIPSGVTLATGTTSSASITINATADSKTITANFAPIWTVAGSMDSWNTTTHQITNITASAGVMTSGFVDITLAANTDYEFKLLNMQTDTWWGSSTASNEINYANRATAKGLVSGGANNQKIRTATAGTYRFTWNVSSSQVTVTYPHTAYKISMSFGTEPTVGSFTATTLAASAIGGNITSAVGSVTGSLQVDGAHGTQYVKSGETVVFTHSAAASGYTWDKWGSSYNAAGRTITAYTAGTYVAIDDAAGTLTLSNITADKSVYSFFKENATTITINTANSNYGDLTVGGAATAWGSSIALGTSTYKDIRAAGKNGYMFTTWAIGGSTVKVSGNLTDQQIRIKGNGTASSTGTATASFAYGYVVRGSTYADNEVLGGMPGWDATDSYLVPNLSTGVGTYTATLNRSTRYKFKVFFMEGTGYWWGTSETSDISGGTSYTLTGGNNDITFTSGAAGTYTFTYNFSTHALTVTYPTAYSVTYYGNGSTSGSVPTDATPYGYGETVSVAGNTGSLTKSNYTLSGWNTTEHITGTTYSHAGGASFTITANTNLYAKWTHSISLDREGAGSGATSVTATYNSSTLTGWTAPTKTGYTFGGYWTGDDGTGAMVINTSGVLQANVSGYTGSGGIWTSSTARTLYAKWTANEYTVNLDRNSGTTGATSVTMTYNSSTMAGYSAPTRTGYTFGGYWTSETSNNGSGTLVIDTDGNLQANVTGYTGAGGVWTKTTATTLYAKWTINTYTVTVTTSPAGYGTVNASSVTSVPYGSTFSSSSNTFTINGTTVTATPTAATAQYTYAFSSWTNASGTVIGDVTVTANFTRTTNTYTILWKNEAGTSTLETDASQAYGTATAFNGSTPTKPTDATYTYTFDGWTTAANGGGTYYANGSTPAVGGAATYYAHFSTTDNVASVHVGAGAKTYFTTLAAAFTNAKGRDNAVITILDDISGIDAVMEYDVAKTCTLDLNNFTVAGTVDKLLTINNASANFIITDNSGAKGGVLKTVVSDNARVYCVYITAGTVNMNNGKVYCQNTHTYTSAAENKNTAVSAVYVTAGQTFIMNNGTVESEAQRNSYAIYAAQGSSTITINNGYVYGHTNSSAYAGGIYHQAKGDGLIVNGGHIVGHSKVSYSYGIYLYGGHATVNGGTIEATNDASTGTTTAYGIYVQYVKSAYRGQLTIPSTSTASVSAVAKTNTAYAVYVYSSSATVLSNGATIEAGTFTAQAKTGYTANGIRTSGGNVTVSGGTFTVSAATTSGVTTSSCGVYSQRGKITVNGSPTFNVSSGASRAYGAFAYGVIGDKGTADSKFSGDIEINGGTFTVTTTTTNAYGAFAGLATKTVAAAEGNVAGTHYMPGKVTINGGTFNVTATTNTAYGVYVSEKQAESGDVGTTVKRPTLTVTGGKFKMTSTGDATKAYAMNTAADNTDLLVQGGYYSTKKTGASTNIESKYTAPNKSDCYYTVEATTAADRATVGEDYLWKVGDFTNIFEPAAESGVWSAPANWTKGVVPTIETYATIRKPCTVDITNAKAKSIVIDQSSTNTGALEINPGKELVVATTLKKTTDGSSYVATAISDLYIGSDASNGNGALVVGSECANTAAGVGLYTKARKDGGYVNQFIGVPLAEMTAYNGFYGMYVYGYDDVNDAWKAVSNNGAMYPFKAYNLLRKQADPTTLYMEGVLNLPGTSGTEVLSMGSRTGDHLFANSWTAPIDVASITASDFSNAEATIYIFNAGTKSEYDTNGGNYTTKKTNNPGQWLYMPVATVKASPSDFTLTVIPSMEAFMVKSTASSGSLTLDYKKHVYDPAVAGDAAVVPNRAPSRQTTDNGLTRIRLYVEGASGPADNLLMFEREDFSTGFDNGWEARKVMGSDFAPQMYAMTDDGKMAINCVPNFDGTLIGFKAGTEDDNYTFTFDYDEEAEPLYLLDMHTSAYTRVTKESSYLFFTADKEEHERFILTRNAPGIATGVGNGEWTNGENGVQKIIMEDHVFILRGGQIYDVTGKKVN